MFGQLLEAIVFLQEHLVSHRDIKSDNVLLDFDMEGTAQLTQSHLLTNGF